MQTFMPDSDFKGVAKSLDNKRLGKQRVEAFQILKALRGEYGTTGAWVNHPATTMWRNHIGALCDYGIEICLEWKNRGFDDSLLYKFLDSNTGDHTKPWWVNDRILHITHQSNLLRKDWDYYSKYFRVPDDLPYLWPLEDEVAFRCGTLKERNGSGLLSNGTVYLTSKQVAELLGVSPKTISAYKARNQMPKPDREYGRTPLWKHSTIEQWRGTLRTPVVPNK
jgi:predicted DNA-binding transcriptional regulator AlpA